MPLVTRAWLALSLTLASVVVVVSNSVVRLAMGPLVKSNASWWGCCSYILYTLATMQRSRASIATHVTVVFQLFYFGALPFTTPCQSHNKLTITRYTLNM
ncbi:hypothetical protein BC835DRAFT_1320298 [Cytidiella melzeri]|nr:hypothetical protein BC835DRAFT_1320298 [Cytidiella melzeri]